MLFLRAVGRSDFPLKPLFLMLNSFLQVGLLNVDGYYDALLALIDSAVDEGFIDPSQRHIFISAPTAKELVQKLVVPPPPPGPRAHAFCATTVFHPFLSFYSLGFDRSTCRLGMGTRRWSSCGGRWSRSVTRRW